MITNTCKESPCRQQNYILKKYTKKEFYYQKMEKLELSKFPSNLKIKHEIKITFLIFIPFWCRYILLFELLKSFSGLKKKIFLIANCCFSSPHIAWIKNIFENILISVSVTIDVLEKTFEEKINLN